MFHLHLEAAIDWENGSLFEKLFLISIIHRIDSKSDGDDDRDDDRDDDDDDRVYPGSKDR